ncbi:MAG: hypothetical protein ABIA93_07990 [Candidatus Woesearchaeota archaeon]
MTLDLYREHPHGLVLPKLEVEIAQARARLNKRRSGDARKELPLEGVFAYLRQKGYRSRGFKDVPVGDQLTWAANSYILRDYGFQNAKKERTSFFLARCVMTGTSRKA